MARPLYSTRFLAPSGAGNQTVDYTVPAGYIAIVRDVTAYLGGDTVEVAQCYLTDPQCVLLSANGSTDGAGVRQWTGRQVLEAGEVLQALILTTVFTSLIASGYLFTV